MKYKKEIYTKNTHKLTEMKKYIEKKGISLLIEVFKTIPDIDLIIAGDGPLRNQYMKEVNGYKNIKFIGWVNNKETFLPCGHKFHSNCILNWMEYKMNGKRTIKHEKLPISSFDE